MKLEVLMSDEFVEFSEKIRVLHDQKKELNAQFKKLYEEHKATIKALDEEAKLAQDAFDQWADSNIKS